MSLHLGGYFVTTTAEGLVPAALRRAAARLLARARSLRLRGAIRAMVASERLSAAELRDLGLGAGQVMPVDEQIRQAPIWGPGGVMWRP
jgi:uncharacterized protein YjiS (DUF1127 family)